MDEFVINQIKTGLKYVPVNLLKYIFIPKSSPETEKLRDRGFICGVCHPRGDLEKVCGANIEWIRADIPFPYEKDGSISAAFTDFRKRCEEYREKGLKVMAITPYPQEYLRYGIDLKTEEGEQAVRDIAVFILNELKDLAGALQVTNEMGIPRFTIPLTLDEAARFIGIQLEAMYPVRGDVIIGYNCAGPAADLNEKTAPYVKYCDYIGVDIYAGCFMNFPGFLWMFDAVVNYLWALNRKPVILEEFGYIGTGAPKSRAQRTAILKKYGASTEKEAKKNIVSFVEALPDHFKEHIKHLAQGDESMYYGLLFKGDLRNHLFCELPRFTKIPGMPHTPEGQALFYKKLLPRLYKKPFMAGAIVYCYADTDACYVCGQEECPTETSWGLVDRDLNPKPSYYAVKEAFENIRNNRKG